jgi:hypothetical protein
MCDHKGWEINLLMSIIGPYRGSDYFVKRLWLLETRMTMKIAYLHWNLQYVVASRVIYLMPFKVGLAALNERLDALFDIFALHDLLEIG